MCESSSQECLATQWRQEGALAAVPLALRVGALSVTLAIMLFDRRRVLLAVLAGEATLIGGAYVLLAL